jgi:hypothetical protein
MNRDDLLAEALKSIRNKGFGCQTRPIQGMNHLRCSHLAEDGTYVGPSFWLSISGRGDWFIFTMQDECYIIPPHYDIAAVATEILSRMGECMGMPDHLVAKYDLRPAVIVNNTDVLDIDYEIIIRSPEFNSTIDEVGG